MLSTFRPMANRLELTFWVTIIPLLSESKITQETLIRSFHVTRVVKNTLEDRFTKIISISGLLMGFIIGLLSSSF